VFAEGQLDGLGTRFKTRLSEANVVDDFGVLLLLDITVIDVSVTCVTVAG